MGFSLKFCPKCETRMKPKIEEDIIVCPKCGFTIAKGNDKPKIMRESEPSSIESGSNNSLKIMDIENGPHTLPTTTIDCPKCTNGMAFWWMLQTRSADEPTTQFYRCTKCGYTWRNYA